MTKYNENDDEYVVIQHVKWIMLTAFENPYIRDMRKDESWGRSSRTVKKTRLKLFVKIFNKVSIF